MPAGPGAIPPPTRTPRTHDEHEESASSSPPRSLPHEGSIGYSKWGRVRREFTQQNLRAWRPIITPNVVIASFIGVAAVFLGLGGLMYDASSDIYECMKRYDNVPGDQATNRNAPVTVIRLQLTEDDCVGKRKGRGIEGPVFVYYRVEKFYQTHRLLFESRNEEQLRGKIVTSRTDLEGCEPWIEVTDPNSTDPTDPTSSYYGKLLLPCGMFAKSVFNDTFEFSDAAGPLRVDTRAETISWNTERKHKYHNPPNSGRVVEWLKTYVPTSQGEFNPYRTDTGTELIFPGGIEDGHFMNWMRLAGLPNFRKLWGKINQDVALPVTVTIQSRWPVKSFGGEKWIILSTVTWLGGRNFFLAYSYFIVGGCCFIFGVFFLIRHWTDYRELGDVDFVALSQPGNK